MENKRRLIQENRDALAARFLKEREEKRAASPIPKPPSPLVAEFLNIVKEAKFPIGETPNE